mgnify:CR=1 FL=1
MLIVCTVISIIISNSAFAENYIHFWHAHIDLSFSFVDLNLSVEHWVNDGLMAIFFLLVGLEIERELYFGELSTMRTAMLPVLAAIGGMVVPALIHFSLNEGTVTESGFGIPMATDIAFALGILSLAGKGVPVSLKIFLTALAIIDDLGAIVVIAIFYGQSFSILYLAIALGIFFLLFFAGKRKMNHLSVYLLGGVVMWYCMMQSGIHSAIAGVLLAFAIPFHRSDEKNISLKLQHFLHYPVAYFILPLFALANTAIIIPPDPVQTLSGKNSLGIIAGLVLGKFIGIFFVTYAAVKMKFGALASELRWRHILGISVLGGIGFTMSIFIANLAFTDPEIVTASKISILVASAISAIAGLIILTLPRSSTNNHRH